jgi:hypothetical protein
VVLENFENGQYGVTDPKTKIGLAIKIHPDSSLVYGVAVPIKYILGSDLNSSYHTDNFSVGIAVNANANPNPSSNYPHASYGGGGMRGMGMHAGGGRNYGSANGTAPKAEENWCPFRLVYKKTAT